MATQMARPPVEQELTARAQPGYRKERRNQAINPTPLALLSLGFVTLAFGVVESGWMTADAEPGILAFALVTGGLLSFVAGLLAFIEKHPVEGTVYALMGAFWFGYYALKTGLLASIPAAGTGQPDFLGFFYLAFAIAAVYGAIATYRVSWPVLTSLVLLAVTMGSMAIGVWAASTGWTQFGGWMGIITAVVAVLGSLVILTPGANADGTLPSERRRS